MIFDVFSMLHIHVSFSYVPFAVSSFLAELSPCTLHALSLFICPVGLGTGCVPGTQHSCSYCISCSLLSAPPFILQSCRACSILQSCSLATLAAFRQSYCLSTLATTLSPAVQQSLLQSSALLPCKACCILQSFSLAMLVASFSPALLQCLPQSSILLSCNAYCILPFFCSSMLDASLSPACLQCLLYSSTLLCSNAFYQCLLHPSVLRCCNACCIFQSCCLAMISASLSVYFFVLIE